MHLVKRKKRGVVILFNKSVHFTKEKEIGQIQYVMVMGLIGGVE